MSKNIKMHQGDSYAIPIELTIDGVPLTPDMVEDLEICVGSEVIRSLSAGDLLLMEDDGCYCIIPTQKETLAMRPGQYDVAVRAKYKDTPPWVDVEPIGRITILPSGFKEVI